jgi:hypothetical protein
MGENGDRIQRQLPRFIHLYIIGRVLVVIIKAMDDVLGVMLILAWWGEVHGLTRAWGSLKITTVLWENVILKFVYTIQIQVIKFFDRHLLWKSSLWECLLLGLDLFFRLVQRAASLEYWKLLQRRKITLLLLIIHWAAHNIHRVKSLLQYCLPIEQRRRRQNLVNFITAAIFRWVFNDVSAI